MKAQGRSESATASVHGKPELISELVECMSHPTCGLAPREAIACTTLHNLAWTICANICANIFDG